MLTHAGVLNYLVPKPIVSIDQPLVLLHVERGIVAPVFLDDTFHCYSVFRIADTIIATMTDSRKISVLSDGRLNLILIRFIAIPFLKNP